MIELRNVCKYYCDNGKEIEALKNINLSFNKGEIVGIIGYSGAGKSTLLRSINFLEPPSSGDVIINGVSLNKLTEKELREIRKNIGMVFQHFNLMKSRTVAKNVAYPLKRSNLTRKEIEQRVDELLKLVNLEEKKDNYPSQLSGGQKQRVGIARALANRPDIILCDEATSALDPETTTSILKLLKKINQELGVTIILITHQMEVIKEICDRVIVMENGEIKEQGDIFQVFSKPQKEITKRFLSTIFNTQKIYDYLENLTFSENEHLVKLSYIGNDVKTAYISKISREYGIDANILFGNIEVIKGRTIGNLIVKFEGEKNKVLDAINYLEEKNIEMEVLKNVGNYI